MRKRSRQWDSSCSMVILSLLGLAKLRPVVRHRFVQIDCTSICQHECGQIAIGFLTENIQTSVSCCQSCVRAVLNNPQKSTTVLHQVPDKSRQRKQGTRMLKVVCRNASYIPARRDSCARISAERSTA
jgi:hypothetical protein